MDITYSQQIHHSLELIKANTFAPYVIERHPHHKGLCRLFIGDTGSRWMADIQMEDVLALIVLATVDANIAAGIAR